MLLCCIRPNLLHSSLSLNSEEAVFIFLPVLNKLLLPVKQLWQICFCLLIQSDVIVYRLNF